MKNDKQWFINRSFLFLWIGETISELGGAIGSLCNALLLYELTGSKAAMGTLWLMYFIPSLCVQLFIGPIIDRMSRKKIMIFSQLIRGCVFFLPVVLAMFYKIEVWNLFVIQIILGIIQPLYVPAEMAILPTIIPSERLTQANAWIDGTVRLMSFLAPAIGGFMFSVIDFKFMYAVVGSLFLLSSISLLNLHEINQVIQQKAKPIWMKQVMLGYRYFFKQKILIWLGVFSMLVQFGVGVTNVINVPYIIEELRGSSFLYGLFIGSFPLGYVIGSFLVGRFSREIHTRRIMLGGLLFGGLSFFLLSFTHTLPLAIACEMMGGIFFPFFNVYNTTLYQKKVPNHLAGQIFSVRLFFIRVSMPLGILFAGQFVEPLGVRTLYMIIGLLIVIPALIASIVPFFSFLDEEEQKHSSVL
ncbi:MFS transporter [Microbacteriaceae bacterium 4G12]